MLLIIHEQQNLSFRPPLL